MFKVKSVDTTIIVVIAVAALSRLIPHWPNFTPVMAIALVGGVVLSKRWLSVLVPLAAMVMSDLALGAMLGWEYAMHGTQWAVYGAVAAIALMGRGFASSSTVKTTLVGGTIAGVGFFLVTNFAVWLSGGFYPLNIQGLAACYAAGLAFYREGGNFLLNGVVSTWLYAALMLVAIRSLSQRGVELQKARS